MPTRPTKDWQDSPSTATPIDAAALEDADDRGFDYTDDSVAEHSADTTSVHGIADTSALATDAELAAHAADGTSVHGIADTADLVDVSDLATHAADATAVHGILDANGFVYTKKATEPADADIANSEVVVYVDPDSGSPVFKGKDSAGNVLSPVNLNDLYWLRGWLATKGDLFVGQPAGGDDSPVVLNVGSNDQVLTADSTATPGVKWAAVTVADGFVTAAKVNTALKPSGTAATTDESLRRLGTGATHAAAGDDSRFPTTGQKNALAGTSGTPGTGNEYATKATTDALATADAAKVPNALVDAKGDILTATANDTPARLAVGTNDFVLTADSSAATGIKWAAASGGGIAATIVDAKGDIIAATAADTVARLAVGSNDQVLTADSAQSTGLKWATPSGGGGGAAAFQYASGKYYGSPGVTNVGASILFLDRIQIFPMWLDSTTTWDRMVLNVNSAGTAGCVYRLGIYAPHATNGGPGALIVDAGTVTGTATGDKLATISQTLTAGLIWLAIATQVAAPGTVTTIDTVATGVWGLFPQTGAAVGDVNQDYYAGGVSGALPDPAPALTAHAGVIPRVMLRKT